MDKYERALQIARGEIYGEFDHRTDPDFQASLAAIRDKARFNSMQPPAPRQPRVEWGENRHHAEYQNKVVAEQLYRARAITSAQALRMAPDADLIFPETLPRVARTALALSGITPEPLQDSMPNIRRAETSTELYPSILENIASSALTQGYYTSAEEVWPRLVRTTTTADFRQFARPSAPLLAEPTEVSELSEITAGVLYVNEPDGAHGSITSYAQLVNFSRALQVNDQADALIQALQSYGATISRLRGNQFFALLAANAALSDGVPLFDSGHSNVISAGDGPSVSTIDALRSLVSAQRGPNSEYLNLRARLILAGPQYASELAAIRAALNAWPEQSTDLVTTLTDSRLSASTEWYCFADPRSTAFAELVVLEGSQDGLRLERRKTPIERDGLSWLIGTDHSLLVVNHQAAAKNPGE